MSTVQDPCASPLFQELREHYEAGNLVLFAGAGVSVGAGLPTWPALTKRLLGLLAGRKGMEAAASSAQKNLDGGRYIAALTTIKRELGDAIFGDEIAGALDDRRKSLPAAALAIQALEPKLKLAITTNLDRLLERALGWEAVTKMTEDAARQRKLVLKLHGTLRDRDTWVFTRPEYGKVIFGDPQLQHTFGTIYRAFPILFVGCGLADDNLEHTFQELAHLGGQQAPRHYALMRDGEVEPERQRELEQAGLRFLFFTSYDDLPRILHTLAGTPLPEVPAVHATPAPYLRRRAERAAKRALESGGSVLLYGPKGSGKTTLLHRLSGELKGEGTTVVSLRLRSLGAGESMETWMTSFAGDLLSARGRDAAAANALRDNPLSWPTKLRKLIKDEVLGVGDDHVLLALDDADVVWDLPFEGALRELFRDLVDAAATGRPWDRLRMAFTVSTTPMLAKSRDSISDWSVEIAIDDLDVEEVEALAQIVGRACSRAEAQALLDRVGGHVGILQQILRRWAASRDDLHTVLAGEEAAHGATADHLIKLGEQLRKDPEIEAAVYAVLDDPAAKLDRSLLLRLSRAGLVARDKDDWLRIRYPLHATYLRSRPRPKRAKGSRRK